MPKKAKPIPSAGKVMALVFWDAKGILLINYLEKAKIITGEYYANLLNSIKKSGKRTRFTKRKTCFIKTMRLCD